MEKPTVGLTWAKAMRRRKCSDVRWPWVQARRSWPCSGRSADGDSCVGRADPRGSAVVDLENGPYGAVLVVGGAAPADAFPAGTSLYFATRRPAGLRRVVLRPYQAG